VLVQHVLTELLHDQREEVRSRRKVEDAVERAPRLLVEPGELALEPLEDGVIVERPRHIADPLQQLLEHLLVRRAARVRRDRLARHGAVLVVRHLRARDPDQVEALGERALVREVVDSGQELAVREVAGGAEDDERRRVDWQALESLDERVLLLHDRHGLLRVRLLLRR
jgi:hypothetical protein